MTEQPDGAECPAVRPGLAADRVRAGAAVGGSLELATGVRHRIQHLP
jgi:hypothetical protein